MSDPRIEAAARAICSEIFCMDWNNADVSRKDECMAASRVAIAAADAAAWRPMSEAPRDGTVINVLLPEGISKADQDFYCYPGSRVSFGWAWENGKFRPCVGLTVFVQPTHWQPLPAPPKAEVTE